MKKTVGVITNDPYLFRKIQLTLSDVADVTRTEGGIFDKLIVDRDYSDAHADITVGRHGGADIAIPFGYGELLRAVCSDAEQALLYPDADRCVVLRGKRIRLTELEYSLFTYLFNARRFVGKDELLEKIWGGGSNEGIINVYVHYLREKLEASGERVIICSRKQGYRIDEKYLRTEG